MAKPTIATSARGRPQQWTAHGIGFTKPRASLSSSTESPRSSWACITTPSGASVRSISSAPNACLMKSIRRSVPFTWGMGVSVPKPAAPAAPSARSPLAPETPVMTMIPVTDLDRARAFYEEKLGLSLKGSLPNGNSVFSL
jgi:hypothetical protein